MLVPSMFNNNMFDDLFDFPFADFSYPVQNADAMMKTDIRETESSYILEVCLPGFKKEGINAELKNGYLTINAKTTQEESDKKEKYIRRERYYGSCSRSFYVGKQVTQEEIGARFENGILYLTVPKKDPRKPEKEEKKYISID